MSDYYESGKPFSIANWNKLLQDVNELALNPDDGCDPVEPLELVSPPHRWSKSDIQEVQDKLKEICSENEFDDIPELWKRQTIDELEEAINRGWCDCCETEQESILLHEANMNCAAVIYDLNCGDTQPSWEDSVPAPALVEFDWYSLAMAMTIPPGIGGGVSFYVVGYNDLDEAVWSIMLYNNLMECNGQQRLPKPEVQITDGVPFGVQWAHNYQVFYTTESQKQCFLFWCITVRCHFGAYDRNSPEEMAQLPGDMARWENLVCNDSFHTSSRKIRWLLVKSPAYCNKTCCADGIGFKPEDCPGERDQ